MLYLIKPNSLKYGIVHEDLDTADTNVTCIVLNFELDETFITPGGVPGVLDQPVMQTSGLVNAVADHEHGMVDRVKVSITQAIFCIYDTACIGVDILVIGRNNDGKRLSCNCGLYIV